MCIIITILPVEEEAAATLRIQVPKQYTKATLGEEAGEVDWSCGFSDAPLDIVYSYLFQKLKLMTKHYLS